MPDLPLPIEYLLTLIIALVYDLFLGDPYPEIHPATYMGKLVGFWERIAPRKNLVAQLIFGFFSLIISTALLLGLSLFFFMWLREQLYIAAVVIEAFLFKCCFSVKIPGDISLKVRRLLGQSKMEEARQEVRKLVSRDVNTLNQTQIISATIESLAKHTTDSFVAPLVFFALLGAPGALSYRLVNIFAASWRKYPMLGKPATLLYEILNFLPAFLSAFLFWLSAGWYRGNRKNAGRIARRDHANSASLSAGWTMSTLAGALRVQLEKIGFYKLGEPEEPLALSHINQATASMYLVTMETVAFYTIGSTIITIIMLS